ncbi:MAG TPA: nucleoside-diphosphate kinase [Desulfosporosinus sp.]|jgi:nucleoside-diphosphate kinase|nr:nucleoside-diphosphate kinase [Desulfosporosinus sp.]
MEKTFIMLKPDAVQRGLVGEVITRFEKKGFKLAGMKFIQVDRALAEAHYAEHRGKMFFEPTVTYIISSPVVAMVWQGNNAVALARQLMGSTKPVEANPGSIRGMFGVDVSRNIIHGSDSVTSAEREIALYFKPEELIDYSKAGEEWLSE